MDCAVETRIDERPDDQVWIGDAELGKEAKAQAGLDHSLHPIVAR
jgi:hypothetical protein